jgi:hypothetical protein
MLRPDYARLFKATAPAVLAGVALALDRWWPRRLPWLWLVLSAVGAAINEWLAIWPPIGSATALQVVRQAVAAVALLSLVEFGRSSLRSTGRTSLGPWIHLPLLLVILGWIAWSDRAATALSPETNRPAPLVQVAQTEKHAGLRYSPDDRLRTGLPVMVAIFAGCAAFIAACALANRHLGQSASSRKYRPRQIAATADRSHCHQPAPPGRGSDT